MDSNLLHKSSSNRCSQPDKLLATSQPSKNSDYVDKISKNNSKKAISLNRNSNGSSSQNRQGSVQFPNGFLGSRRSKTG